VSDPLALLPLAIPALAKVAMDLFGRKIPKRLKPAAAVAAGAAVGLGAHALGMDAHDAAALAGLVGPGAIAANEVANSLTQSRERKAVRVSGPDPASSRKVGAGELPGKD